MAGSTASARRFASAAEPLHSCAYYAPEINEFTSLGFHGWWHAYFAYRSAPLGNASSQLVTEVFYNFAPRMVERSVPGCWEILAADAVRREQLSIVGRALTRIFDSYAWGSELRTVVELLAGALPELDVTNRPLFAAWASQPWPEESVLGLWHASTLLREFRFDGHNEALRQAGVSGLGSHLLMVADGRGTPDVVQKIRGWTPDEWATEMTLLQDAGWLDPSGLHTTKGRSARKEIELQTDQHAASIPSKLGEDNSELVLGLLERVSQFLLSEDVVPGKWPPSHLGRIDPSSE